MKIQILTILLAAAVSPALAGDLENQAADLAVSFASLSAPAVSGIQAPEPVRGETKAPVQNWAEAAKTAYERELDAGGLTEFADILELPPGARRQLEQEWQTLPEGPGNSSEAFKLTVNGRTAFIVQSYIYSDSMRVYLFNAAGVRVAYGEGTADTGFAWVENPSPVESRRPRTWAEAAKAAYMAELDAGGLTDFADLQELPPGARSQLEREWQTLPQGPGNSSEAFKLTVAGRTAFVVQSYIYSDSMRAYIFNAAGVLVAYGEGSIEKDFAWLPLPY